MRTKYVYIVSAKKLNAGQFKVRLCVIVLSVTVCTMFVYFVGLKFSWILLVSNPR